MTLSELSFDHASLQSAYKGGANVRDIIAEARRRCASDTNSAFIHRLTEQELKPYVVRLDDGDPGSLPLYGVPFAIKDNIDLAHIPTTAACPEFSYTPEQHAFLIKQLIDAGAGAVSMGKTNLSQFPTGLNGTRSPFGACRNAFNPDFISGGSSSGSAVAVAKGRVPASFNNLIELKPTIGLFSATGVVPACRSVQNIHIFVHGLGR